MWLMWYLSQGFYSSWVRYGSNGENYEESWKPQQGKFLLSMGIFPTRAKRLTNTMHPHWGWEARVCSEIDFRVEMPKQINHCKWNTLKGKWALKIFV